VRALPDSSALSGNSSPNRGMRSSIGEQKKPSQRPSLIPIDSLAQQFGWIRDLGGISRANRNRLAICAHSRASAAPGWRRLRKQRQDLQPQRPASPPPGRDSHASVADQPSAAAAPAARPRGSRPAAAGPTGLRGGPYTRLGSRKECPVGMGAGRIAGKGLVVVKKGVGGRGRAADRRRLCI
jgi:hypothetical protein